MSDHDRHLVPVPKELVTTVGRQLAVTEKLLANQLNPPLLVPQFWHPGGVTSLAFSPDSQTIALGGQDHAVRLWDIESGVCLRVLEGQAEENSSVFFSPDGMLIGSVAGGDTIRLWEIRSGKLLQEVRANSKRIYSAVFTSSTRIIAAVKESGSFSLWDVGNEVSIKPIEGLSGGVNFVVFAPDGQVTLYIGDTSFCVEETKSGKCLQRAKANLDGALSVAVTPNGQMIVSGWPDGKICLWNAVNGDCLRTWTTPTEDFIYSVAVSCDGRLVASGESGCVRLWDVETGACRLALGYRAEIYSVYLSPPNQFTALGSWNGTVCIRDVDSEKRPRILEWKYPQIFSAIFSPEAEVIAKVLANGTIRLWDGRNGNFLKDLNEHSGLMGGKSTTWQDVLPRAPGLRPIVFSPDGRIIASGEADGTIRLWDIETGQGKQVLGGHSRYSSPAAFSLDGQALVSIDEDDTICLWAVDSAECLLMIGHTEAITCVCFSPDGRLLASGTEEGDIFLWAVEEGKLFKKIEAAIKDDDIDTVAFSTDGRIIIAIGNEETYFYSIDTCKCLWKLSRPSWLEKPTALSPDGKMIAIGSGDGKISLMGTSTGECKAEIFFFPENSWAVVAPDGRYDSSDFGESPWLRWTVSTKSYQVTRFKDRYYTPGLLAQVLAGSAAAEA